jgi:hypothetical protein
MLDEFPTLAELQYGQYYRKTGESVFALVRTLHEEFQRTKLVISGSYRSTLEKVALKKRAPFYNQLLTREIGPFNPLEFEEFIHHYLGHAEWDQGAKEALFNLSGGLPFNLQLLGRELREVNTDKITKELVQKSAESILKTEGDVRFADYLRDLKTYEVRILKAFALHHGENVKKVLLAEYIDEGLMRMGIVRLLKDGLLKRTGRGIYDFVDNLFAEWLKYRDEAA